MYVDLENKVYNLEELLGQFIVSTNSMMKRMDQDTAEFKKDMKIIIKDMKEDTRKMQEDTKQMKEDTKKMKENMEEDSRKMQEDTKKMKENMEEDTRKMQEDSKQFKIDHKQMEIDTMQMKEDTKDMKRQWGKLANKMGTIVEDIIEPSIKPVIKKYFNVEITSSSIHNHKKSKALNLEAEYDIIASGDNKVFVVEVKSSPDKEKLLYFLNKSLPKFKKLFPEYKEMQIIPLFGGIRIEDDLIEVGNKNGVYLIAYREWDYIDILNFDQVHENYFS